MSAFWLEVGLRTAVLLCCGDVCLRLLRDRAITLESRIRRLLLATALLMPLLMVVWSNATASAGNATDGWRVGDTTVAAFATGLPVWVAVAYLLVSAVLLARLVVGLLCVRRLWAQARPVDVEVAALWGRVRESAAVASPVSIGAGVILPPSWRQLSAGELRMVLAHEATHLDRHDFAWSVLARVHRAVFWINPWSWIFESRLRRIAERLSDRAAIQSAGRRDDYVSLLLACAESQIRPSLLAAMARESDLADRIARITRGEDSTRVGRLRVAVIAAAVSVFAIGSACASTLRVSERALVDGSANAPAASSPERASAPLPSLGSLSSLPRLSSLR